MDRIDEELIDAASRGIIRYSEIAKRLNHPLSTVHVRMKKLEKDGVIKIYKADIDWKRAGFGITAFILINIDTHLLYKIKKTQGQLLKQLMSIDYVTEGHIITGEADMMVKVIARDSAHLRDILLDSIDNVEGVVKTKTMIALE